MKSVSAVGIVTEGLLEEATDLLGEEIRVLWMI